MAAAGTRSATSRPGTYRWRRPVPSAETRFWWKRRPRETAGCVLALNPTATTRCSLGNRNKEPGVRVIGGGLAGAEATWQLARRGIEVELYEMRPQRMTGAQKTGALAELVCRNSLKSALLHTARGLLKEEMRRLDSLIIRVADQSRVPAGAALAVDRERFASSITEALERLPDARIVRDEVREIPRGPVIVATGPLTSSALSSSLASLLGA